MKLKLVFMSIKKLVMKMMQRFIKRFIRSWNKNLVITLGEKGVYFENKGNFFVPALI